jgi:hypothetical protein
MKNVNENSKIEALLKQIKTLEKELEDELKKDQKIFYDRIEKGKVIFEEEIIKEGRSKVVKSLQYLSSYSFLSIVTLPIIWSMLIPAVILDIFVTIYQHICFPIYKIPKVKRKEYVVMDRYNLFYLDKIEKINCWYCEYFNGVIAYVREIAARTEQFFCPIKHAKKVHEKHSRYTRFFEFGDYEKYHEQLNRRRADFEDLEKRKD